MQRDAWRSQSPPSCPEPSAILAFLGGVDGPSEELEAHLDTCDDCRRVVAALGRSHLPELEFEPPLPDEPSAEAGTAGEDGRLSPGSVLNGTYRLERLIGSGGMGWVYEAAHLRVPRRFAVKVLRRSAAQEAGAFERFRREAEIASKLGHHNIVEVLDFNRSEDGTPYMVMQLLDGEDLAARLQRAGRFSYAAVCEIFAQIAAGLGVAHARGIVHRDLKPQNIFLCRGDERDQVRILDFGISKLLSGSPTDTRSGTVVGTPRYMAPEQAHGRHGEVDARTDLFALGCILYECLAGRPAFGAPSVPTILHAVCYEPHPPLSSVVEETPPELDALLARALAKERDERPPSVAAFHAELVEAVLPVRSGNAAPAATTPAKPRSGRVAALAAAVAVVAIVVALAWPGSEPSPVGGETGVSDTGGAVAAQPATEEGRRDVAVRAGKAGGAAEPRAALAPSAVAEARVAPEPEARARTTVAPGRKPAPVEAPEPGQAPAPDRVAMPNRVPAAAPALGAGRVPAPDADAGGAEPPAKLGMVEIVLQIEPPGARVEVDGVEIQGERLRLPRSETRHRIAVSAPGYIDAERTFEAMRDASLQVHLDAEPPPLEAGLPGPMEEDL